ncbi:MAG: GspE/PulE family protein, partial [Chthoniobacterales bacterium]
MSANDEYVVEILQESGLVSRSQIEQVKESNPGLPVVDALIEQGLLSQEDVSRTLAAQNGLEYVDLEQVNVPHEIITKLDAEHARRYQALPIQERDESLVIAMSDPLAFDTVDALNHILHRPLEFVCATPAALQKAVLKYYGTDEDVAAHLMKEIGDDLDIGQDINDGEEEEGAGDDAPIIKMVTSLLMEAQKYRASDIHLEPLEKRFRVRFRIDG